MQKMQTKNSTAMHEQSMYRMIWDVPTVLQMKGLQQFKYHILYLQPSNKCKYYWVLQTLSLISRQKLRIFLFIESLMMKGTIVQQPFRKIQSSKHLTIKIHQPPLSPLKRAPFAQNNDLPNVIKEQISQLKARIEKSEKILEESRRQENKDTKVVHSDYIPLHFNYNSANSYKPNLMILDPLDERQSEYSIENEESEGPIQLPVHLQPSIQDRNYLSVRNSQKKHYFKSDRARIDSQQKSRMNWKTDRILRLNDLTNSLQKESAAILIKQVYTPKSNQNNKVYRNNFEQIRKVRNIREQNSIKKENNPSSQYKYIANSKQKQLINQSISTQKIKIKLNRPYQGQIGLRNQYHTRPRYHIKMPSKQQNQNLEIQKQNEVPSAITPKSQWEQLLQKLKKYQFVRKYLSQSDIFRIYEHLKKNHINQEKWPIFVVDEVYKRMKTHKNH